VGELAANHHPDQPIAIDSADRRRTHDLPVAHDRDDVRNPEYLVDLVRDEDYRAPARFEIGDNFEQLRHLPLRKRRRRFVHDEDVRLLRHSPRDLDHLPLGNRQIADAVIGIDVDMESGEQRGRSLSQRTIVDESDSGQRLAPEKQVLRDGHRRQEMELLVNHRDAPAQRDATRIRDEQTGNHVHQG
jgi:hypothetical protein